jgi:hypothetical protein
MVEIRVAVPDAARAHELLRLPEEDAMSVENTDTVLLRLLSTPLSLQQIADLLKVPRADVLERAVTLYARLDIHADG